MASENDRQALREYGNRKKRYKRRRRAVIISLFLFFVIGGASYLYSLYNREYNDYKIIETVETSAKNAVGYQAYGSSIVKYSKDGAVAINKDGSLQWNGSYEMTNPITDSCGEYVAIADKNKKIFYLYDEDGEVINIKTPYDISKIKVAAQGVVAVLMNTDGGNQIILYDKDGIILAEKQTSENKEGYPLDMDISEDGEKMVLSYLSYTGGTLVNYISFYNYGEVGQNKKNNLVGGYPIEEGVVSPKVTFLNNDTICIFKDNGFSLYSMEELPDLIYEEGFDKKIFSVINNEEYVGFVLQAQDALSKSIVLYDLKGKKALDQVLKTDYENVFLSKNEIVMSDNISCSILKINGKIKFHTNFDTNIEMIYPINHLDRYFLSDGEKIYEIKLQE